MKIVRLLRCISALIGIVLLAETGFAQEVKFNGKWELVKGKSDFGGVDPKIATPLSIGIKTSADSVWVSRVFEGVEPFFEVLGYGANEVETNLNDKTLRLSSVSWDKNRKSIIFRNTYEVNGAELVYWRTEGWMLKGKFLEVVRTTVLQDKVERVKGIYIKKG